MTTSIAKPRALPADLVRTMIVTGHAAAGKARLVRLVSAACGGPVATVRMADGLVHAATRGELYCTGVAAPTVGPIGGVVTCFQSLAEMAKVEAINGLRDKRLATAPFTAPRPITAPTPIATAIVIGTAATPITDRRTVVAEHVLTAPLETAATGNTVASPRAITAPLEREPGPAALAREHTVVEHVCRRPTMGAETNLRLRPTG